MRRCAATPVCWKLAAQHGLSELRLGPAPGEIVVTVGRGRDGFDMADFEIEAENVVRALVTVTSDRAARACPVDHWVGSRS